MLAADIGLYSVSQFCFLINRSFISWGQYYIFFPAWSTVLNYKIVCVLNIFAESYVFTFKCPKFSYDCSVLVFFKSHWALPLHISINKIFYTNWQDCGMWKLCKACKFCHQKMDSRSTCSLDVPPAIGCLQLLLLRSLEGSVCLVME